MTGSLARRKWSCLPDRLPRDKTTKRRNLDVRIPAFLCLGEGSADLTGAVDDVFIGAQLLQAHGAPGVELLGGDAHFAAQAELSAVGEPGGGVDINCGAVHARRQNSRAALSSPVMMAVAVAGGVLGDVVNGLLHAAHHDRRPGYSPEIPCQSPVPRRARPLDDGVGLAGPASSGNGCSTGGDSLGPGADRWSMGRNSAAISRCTRQTSSALQTRGTAGLGVLNDVHGHIEVGGPVHIHVADAGAGLDAGHLGVFRDRRESVPRRPGESAGRP